MDDEIKYLQVSDKMQEMYNDEINNNIKYSLEVDPENKYNMTKEQKDFVKYYVDFKNVNTVAEIMKIKVDKANSLFLSYSVRQEIRRINFSLFHRQFSTRLLNLDEIGGYLTSLLVGSNTPLSDQPKNINDRLNIAKLLIQINKIKNESFTNPDKLMNMNMVEKDLKNLSITTIKQMLITSDNIENKNEVISQINHNLTPEESAYLSTLSTEDLLGLIENNEDKN